MYATSYNWSLDNSSTTAEPNNHYWPRLNTDHVIIAMVAINMVGIGGHVDGERLVELLKKPLHVCLAMLLRFAFMPALGLGLVELLAMSPEESMSVLSICLAPHEAIGCLFLLLFDGDLTLAVAIELVNNFSTTAFLPLWAMIYETSIYGSPGHIQLPMRSTFLFLAVMCAAVAMGYLFRNRHSRCYDNCWTWLPGFTIATIVFIVAMQFYNNRAIFEVTSMVNISCALALALAGFLLPALFALIVQQSSRTSLVLCMENGLRTTYITQILATTSYPPHIRRYANVIPTYTSAFTLWAMLCTSLVFRYLKTRSAFKDNKKYNTHGNELEAMSLRNHGGLTNSETVLDISL